MAAHVTPAVRVSVNILLFVYRAPAFSKLLICDRLFVADFSGQFLAITHC